MNINLSFWDITLLIVVTGQSLVLAYLAHPKAKAFMLMLPFPFSVAFLAVNKPIDAANVLGLIVLFLYATMVRFLYRSWQFSIVISIILSALLYCGVAIAISSVLPRGNTTFLLCAVGTMLLAILLSRIMTEYTEPSYRTTLPIWWKLPIVFAVVLGLILIKRYLDGFMTTFPMVGVIGAYESRNSLRTVNKQIPPLMFLLTIMFIVIWITQGALGIYGALAVGWLVFLPILSVWLYLRRRFGRLLPQQSPARIVDE